MKPGRSYKLNREPLASPARKPRAGAAAPARKGALSDKQKARICALANEAAEGQGITHWREKIAWRREQQREKFGLESLTAATQDQYADIKAHFEVLAGDSARAYETTRRGQENKRRVARWNLEKAIGDAGLRIAYAIAICKRQYRCGLEDASTQQLWWLVYTVRNRATAKRHKAEDAGYGNPF